MKKKVLSICLCLILSVFMVVPVFAAEEDIKNWYNTQQPYDETLFYWDAVDGNYFGLYRENGVKFSNASVSSVNVMGFGFNDEEGIGGWEVSMIDAYDYYVNLIVYAEATRSSQFSFFPSDLEVEYNAHDGLTYTQLLENVSISHYDTSHTLGFSAVGKIPDDQYLGCPIRMLRAIEGTGTVPANLEVFIIVYQVPKSDSGSSQSVAAIVSAIENQTRELSGLIQGNGGDPSAGSVNSELNSAISDIDDVEKDIHDQAEEAFRASDSLINQFDPSQFTSAGNLYKELSESAFGALGSVAVFIFIPLILFCAGAFIGKLK